MIVKVCVGSSCHLKGSYAVIEKFTELIKEYSLEDSVNLQASFCLGHCSEGVTVLCDDHFLQNVNASNAEEVFINEILQKVQ